MVNVHSSRWLSLLALICLLLAAPVAADELSLTASDYAPAVSYCTTFAVGSWPIGDPGNCSPTLSFALGLPCANTSGKTISRVLLSYDITHACNGQLRVELQHYNNAPPYYNVTTTVWQGDGTTCGVNLSVTNEVVNAFNGAPASGGYALNIADCVAGTSGALTSLVIKVEYEDPPAVISATPGAGYACPGAVQTFHTVFEDTDGATDIDSAEFLFDEGNLAKVNQVYLQYSRRLNKLYMRNAANTAWLGGFAPGDNQVIETALARLHVADTTVSVNGNQLTVNWAIEFLPPYAGKTYRQMLYVNDVHSGFSGWENMGSWTVSCDPLSGGIRRSYLPLLRG